MAIIHVAGNVGSCDFKYTENGTAYLVVSIADHRWNRKEEKEDTVWIRAIWFGERAEKLSNSITKAKMISVTGKEDFKVYDGKIDRTIEPLDHRILQFKPQQDQSQGNPNQNNQEPPQNDFYGEPPPPNDDDIPFL